MKENSKDGTVYYIDPEEIENISVVYGVVTKEGKQLKGPAIVRPKVGIVCFSLVEYVNKCFKHLYQTEICL